MAIPHLVMGLIYVIKRISDLGLESNSFLTLICYQGSPPSSCRIFVLRIGSFAFGCLGDSDRLSALAPHTTEITSPLCCEHDRPLHGSSSRV